MDCVRRTCMYTIIGTCRSAQGMNPFIGQSGFDSFWLQRVFFVVYKPYACLAGPRSVSYCCVTTDNSNIHILIVILKCRTVYKTKRNNPDFVHHRYQIKSQHHCSFFWTESSTLSFLGGPITNMPPRWEYQW